MSDLTAISSVAGNSLGSSLGVTAAASPVASTTNSNAAQTAVTLSGNAGVIATLGATTSDLQVYSAAGILNTIAQAGSAPTDTSDMSDTQTSQTASQSLNQSILSAVSSGAESSGIYTSAGTLQTQATPDVSANWATALKTDSGLAGTVIGDSFKQGIIGTL